MDENMTTSGPESRKKDHEPVFMRYALSFYRTLTNRRRFERVPLAGTIVATYGSAISVSQTCSCVDISPRGIAIDAPEPIDLGSFVALRSDEHAPQRWARVRYCKPHYLVHRIGLEFMANEATPEV